jgi:hypothetical protein
VLHVPGERVAHVVALLLGRLGLLASMVDGWRPRPRASPCEEDDRRLARATYPDVAGDPAAFRTVEQAYRDALSCFAQADDVALPSGDDELIRWDTPPGHGIDIPCSWGRTGQRTIGSV